MRYRRSPCAAVIVAAHHIHRRNRSQRLQHAGIADIARMDNAIDPGQRFQRLRPEQAVRVRNESDAHRLRRHQLWLSAFDSSLAVMSTIGITRS